MGTAWTWLLVGVCGTVATAVRAVRVPARMRAGWLLVAASAMVVCVTGIVLGRLDLTGGTLTVALLTPGVVAYPLLVVGLLLVRRASGVVRLSDVLDAVVAALGTFLLGWIAIWHPHFRANGVLITGMIAHPIGALITFAVAVTTVFSKALPRLASAALVMAGAVLLTMTSILAATVRATALGVTRHPAVPVLWALFPVLLAAAIGHRQPLPIAAEPGPPPVTAWRTVLIIGAALLGPITWIVIVTTDPPNFALAETAVPVFTDAAISLIVLTRLLLNSAYLQRLRDRLTLQARQDPLTALANRAAVVEALERGFPAPPGRHPAILLLDIDDFKAVNDSLGHAAGDALLVAIAERLTSVLPTEATIGRLGGDEFVVFLPDAGQHHAETAAETIRQAIRRPYDAEGTTVMSSASIGVFVDDASGYDRATALAAADSALYEAKDAGRDRWALYRLSHDTAA